MPGEQRRYECRDPPCLHVVIDERRKIYAVFVELDEENIYQVGARELEKACRLLEEIRGRRFREAGLDETDYLATRYLGASPAPEEYE